MKKQPIAALLLLTLPTVIAIAAVLLLMNLRAPTRFTVELTVHRAAVTVGGDESTAILGASLPVQSVTVEKFDEMTFTPQQMQIADPSKYLFEEDRYPEDAWTPLAPNGPIVMTGADDALQPAVTLENADPADPAQTGRLDSIRVKPGADVVVELRNERVSDVTLTVDGQPSFATLAMPGAFLMINDYVRLDGITDRPHQTAGSLTYSAQLPIHSPFIEIAGSPDALRLLLTVALGEDENPFSTGGIPVTAVDFVRQGLQGNLETTLLPGVEAQISYPDYPDIEPVSFRSPDFLGLDALDMCRIDIISLDREQGGIFVRLNGVAGHIGTGSAEFPRDHRLTRFETFWHSSKIAVLFTIAVWVFSTTLGGRKLWKELAGGKESES